MLSSGSLGPAPAFPGGFTRFPIMGFRKTSPEPINLQVGDLVLWTGTEGKFTSMSRRVIYQVIDRKESSTENSHYVQYRFSVAFDLENPVGTLVDPTPFMTSREMKRLSLLDVGIIRLTLDNFIKEWARRSGSDLEQMPTSSDVVETGEEA